MIVRDRVAIRLNKNIYFSKEFNEFWDKIKYKSIFEIDFDSEEFIASCINSLENNLNIKNPCVIYNVNSIDIDYSGVKSNHISTMSYTFDLKYNLPDIVTYLENETDLTRKTIVRILTESDTLNQFKKNPQEYMQQTVKLINKVKKMIIIGGIRYIKTDDFYSQELFKNEELFDYTDKILLSNKSVYNFISYNSQYEKRFIEYLEKDSDVKLFFKFPAWYKINTPLGNYIPKFAVLFELNGEKLYGIIETVGSNYLNPEKQAKINCGRKHFEDLGTNVLFDVVNNYDEFKYRIVDKLVNEMLK